MDTEKIWMITKTETVLIITCNNVEVLDYKFSDSLDGNCPRMARNTVDQIMFYSAASPTWHDKASDFYRAGKSLNLML